MAIVGKEAKPGDVVWLRCGGPAMMVTSIRQDELVMTEWFDGYQLKRETFDAENLTLTRPFGRAR